MGLKISPELADKLAQQIHHDWQQAQSDHQARLARIERLMQAFRNSPDATGDLKTGYRTPLITETLMAKTSRMLTAMLGTNRKITAIPQGDSDVMQAVKRAAFMDWAIFCNTDPFEELAKGFIRTGIAGRAFWFVPWREKFDLEGKLIWEGHELISIPPADFLHSNEPGVRSVQDFEWVAMRYWESRRSLEEAIARGEYPYLKGIDPEILFQSDVRRDEENDLNRLDDEIEGIDRESMRHAQIADSEMARGLVPMLAWYGWVKIGRKYEHVCIRRPRNVEGVIGSIDRLKDLYPKMSTPRPFLELSAFPHGPYYPKSPAAFCEPAEAHLTEMFRDFYKGGAMAASPPILADRETADQLTGQERGAGSVIVVTEPRNAVPLEVRYDPTFIQIGATMVRADRDRLMGTTDFQSGRDISSPTAPKTASATLALLQESNVRMNLDMHLFGRQFSHWLRHLDELWSAQADPNVYFRVSESYPELGHAGPMRMFETPDERAGRYDYTLQFSPSPMEASATREDTVTAYQLAIANPLIMQSPSVLHRITVSMLKALNQTEAAMELVAPPDNTPIPPARENAMMAQGEMPKVKPGDDHELHKQAHYAFIELQKRSPRGDMEAAKMAVQHILEHNRAEKEAAMTQALMAGVAQSLQQAGGLEAPPMQLPLEQVLAQQGQNQMAQKGAPIA